MFGGTRAISATLGSSEDEEPLLFAVLFRMWGTYILSILCINHQFGATEKVSFKILVPVLPYFRWAEAQDRDIGKKNSDITERYPCFGISLTSHSPMPFHSGDSVTQIRRQRPGGKQPLGFQSDCCRAQQFTVISPFPPSDNPSWRMQMNPPAPTYLSVLLEDKWDNIWKAFGRNVMYKSRAALYMRHDLNHSSTLYKTTCRRAFLNVIGRIPDSIRFEILVLLLFEH